MKTANKDAPLDGTGLAGGRFMGQGEGAFVICQISVMHSIRQTCLSVPVSSPIHTLCRQQTVAENCQHP